MKTERDLYVLECPTCFVTFGVPERLRECKAQDGGEFYCPNGHVCSYGEGALAKTRRERDRLKQQLAEKDDEKRAAIEERDKKIAFLQKRMQRGVCPCCHRSFVALAKHMKTKHPEFGVDNVVKMIEHKA